MKPIFICYNKYLKKYNVTFILGVPNMFKKMYEEKHFSGPHLKKLRLEDQSNKYTVSIASLNLRIHYT